MKTLVLLLHGVGGQGAGMLPLVPHLTAPGLVFRAPDGPGVWQSGRRWFDITGVTTANRPERVRGARAALDAAIDTGLAETQADQVVLLGFSQGAIMAIDALARGRVARIVAFAGRVGFDTAPQPLPGALALLIGGTQDRVMTAADVTEAASVLRAAGVGVNLLIEPQIGHEIGPQGLAAARAFLDQ